MLFTISLALLVGSLLSFMIIIALLLSMHNKIKGLSIIQYDSSYADNLDENINNISNFAQSGGKYFIVISLLSLGVWLSWVLLAGDAAINDLNNAFSMEDFNQIFIGIMALIFSALFLSTNYMIIKLDRENKKVLQNMTGVTVNMKKDLENKVGGAIFRYCIYTGLFSLYFIPIFTVLR